MKTQAVLLGGIAMMVSIIGCNSTTAEEAFDPKAVATKHVWYQKDTCQNPSYVSIEFSDNNYTQILYEDEDFSIRSDGIKATITALTDAGIDMIWKEGGKEGKLICNIFDDIENHQSNPDSITIDCNPEEEDSPIDGFLRTMWKSKTLAKQHPYNDC